MANVPAIAGRDKKVIALTPGEPAGIGPDLTVMIAQAARDYPLVAICDPALLESRAEALKLKIKPSLYSPQNVAFAAGEISVLGEPMPTPCIAGRLNASNSSYVINTLKRANDGCLAGEFSAMVTGPVQKSIINEAGFAFSGHTEYLAQQSHTDNVVMMLACEKLRVALATTHLPLKDVSSSITQQSLTETIEILMRDLTTKFGIISPRVLVCGLNPHAGENGHLGTEELDTIIPVLARLKAKGHNVIGPLPADTLFNPRHLKGADAVLAMYHDQGLPVLKHIGFGSAVNITLGLPYIRTSVDHGTALDLAGKGTADPGSLLVAINYARQLAHSSGETAIASD